VRERLQSPVQSLLSRRERQAAAAAAAADKHDIGGAMQPHAGPVFLRTQSLPANVLAVAPAEQLTATVVLATAAVYAEADNLAAAQLAKTLQHKKKQQQQRRRRPLPASPVRTEYQELMQCPQGCGQDVPTKGVALRQHLAELCSARLIKCSMVGCSELVQACLLQQHLRSECLAAAKRDAMAAAAARAAAAGGSVCELGCGANFRCTGSTSI
jgi:hypothetical protein